jgi:hypothetical protein
MLLAEATPALPHGSVKREDTSAVSGPLCCWDSVQLAPFCEVFLQPDVLN